MGGGGFDLDAVSPSRGFGLSFLAIGLRQFGDHFVERRVLKAVLPGNQAPFGSFDGVLFRLDALAEDLRHSVLGAGNALFGSRFHQHPDPGLVFFQAVTLEQPNRIIVLRDGKPLFGGS